MLTAYGVPEIIFYFNTYSFTYFFLEQTLVEHLLCMRDCVEEMWHDDCKDGNI